MIAHDVARAVCFSPDGSPPAPPDHQCEAVVRAGTFLVVCIDCGKPHHDPTLEDR